MTDTETQPAIRLNDLDRRVLAHIRKYPGLSLYEISRALNGTDRQHQNNPKMLWPLMHLMQAGLIRFEQVEAPTPIRVKHLWYPAEKEENKSGTQ